MSVLQIVCQNCGAKYKLPESFQGDKAKCKACSAVIDVAAQRASGGVSAAAPKPAAVKPAGAKPAAARPARAASAARSAPAAKGKTAASAGTGASRRGAGAGTARGARAGGRRGAAEAEPKKKGNPALLIGGVVVVVAVIVGFLMSGGDAPNEPQDTQTAQANQNAQGNTQAAGQSTGANANESSSQPSEAAPAEATPVANEEPKEEATPATTEPTPAEEKAAPKAAPAKTELTSRGDVYDPKTLDPLEYPAEVDAALQSEIAELLQDLADGGVSGIRAKGRLEEIGWPALFGIINYLRTIDYFDSDASMTAYELNRLLEAMAVGINVGYRPPQIGEEQPLEDVDWNAKTVKAWIRLPTKYPTPEDFARLRQNRQSRSQGR
jgi:hypothetical protein